MVIDIYLQMLSLCLYAKLWNVKINNEPSQGSETQRIHDKVYIKVYGKKVSLEKQPLKLHVGHCKVGISLFLAGSGQTCDQLS